jgi:hypothetical protein
MSFNIVDMPSLGVRIPATFKRMAEQRSIHRDATSDNLDICQTGPTLHESRSDNHKIAILML